MTFKKEVKMNLDKILLEHALWLQDNGGRRADLRYADLRGADLRDADLRGADLRGAILSCADLRGAILSCADLRDAILSCADLRGADLRGAILRDANLRDANLSGANLSGADLRYADLRGADLRDAILSCADLRGADLRGAYICGADLTELCWGNTVLNLRCPECGEFIGFKKADGLIIKLKITSDSKRSSATTNKCRCSKAKVLEITNIDGTASNVTRVCSDYDSGFEYEIGETVEVTNFNDNRWEECSTGIHFFVTRKEAVEY